MGDAGWRVRERRSSCGAVVWRLGPPRATTASRCHDYCRRSVASATLAVGLAIALVGASFGLWLLLIGVGVAVLGLGGLVREQLARRRAPPAAEDAS